MPTLLGRCAAHAGQGLAQAARRGAAAGPWAGRAALACAVALLGAPAPGRAEGVWRWTDAQGKTHYAEVVPAEYRGRARRVASRLDVPAPPVPADSAPAKSPPAPPRAAASAPADPAPPPRVAQVPDEHTDCETWVRLYRQSLDCFAPYKTASGATKAEAFEHCQGVSEPSSRCRRR